MDFDFETDYCDLFELFVHLFSCPIVRHIQSYLFESDLNYLLGSFNILNEAWLYSFNDLDDG